MESNERMDRRRFVAVLAAGAAAAAAVPIVLAEAAETRGSAPAAKPAARRPMSAAMRQELENQRKSVADMLRVIRSHELPAGSPPATVFRARRTRRPK